MDKLIKVGNIDIQFSTNGLAAKMDLINQAIDLYRQADDLIRQANRISVDVYAEEFPLNQEF